LGATKRESEKAFLEAEKSFSRFQKEWRDRINRLPTEQLFERDFPTPALRRVQGTTSSVEVGGRETGVPLRVAFIGHPYNLFDTDINKDLLTLSKKLGMEVVTSDSLSEKEIDQEVFDLSKEIYWSSGREIVGSLFHFLSGGVDGVIFLTSFKCGIDALLQEFIKRSLKVRGGSSLPLLILSFDEHTGREGLITRLEAFRDVMEQRKVDNN
jgi:predicted nucleotide-binding protein (sugar kinase/HSP70/actin superfamily)